MPRSRLRAHLDEVIADEDLRANIDQVVSEPASTPIAPGSAGPVGNGAPEASGPPVEAHVPAFAPTAVPAPSPASVGADTSRLTPPEPGGPGGPAPAPRGAAHVETFHSVRRRRRSASLLPPLPSPADLADDAPGRVELVTITPPADVTPPPPPRPVTGSAPASPQPTGALPAASRLPLGDALGAWLPVAALGVALLVIFIIGMVVTH